MKVEPKTISEAEVKTTESKSDVMSGDISKIHQKIVKIQKGLEDLQDNFQASLLKSEQEGQRYLEMTSPKNQSPGLGSQSSRDDTQRSIISPRGASGKQDSPKKSQR